MKLMHSAITLKRVFLSLMLCCLSFFSSSLEKQFACSHLLLDFLTFLQIIEQWLLLDAGEAASLLLFKAQPPNVPARLVHERRAKFYW